MITNQRTTDTAQPCGAGLRAAAFWILALSTNTGTVYIDRKPGVELPVDPPERTILTTGPDFGTKDGIPLQRGEFVTLPGPLLSDWWMDATANDKLYILPRLAPLGWIAQA